MSPSGATPSIRRLALADLDEPTLRRLIDHGEDLFVERKRELPAGFRFGEAAASFANTLGGWLLLGIDDAGSLVGWEPAGRADPQAHLGTLLRQQVDPLPPFVAGTRELDGKQVGVVRIFESADRPHIVRGTGAVYVRTSAGKEPVRDQSLLLQLAREGADALAESRDRLGDVPLVREALSTGLTDTAVIVRAAPVSVAPHFEDWAVSRRVAAASERALAVIADERGLGKVEPVLQPRGRGIVSYWHNEDPPVSSVVVVAARGVIGVKISDRSGHDRALESFRADFRLATHTVHALLVEGEAYGRSSWDADVSVSVDASVAELPRAASRTFYLRGELPIPADEDEQEELVGRWIREFAREGGAREWEP